MSDDGKKPGAAFWMTVVVIVVLSVYPLSFGPACSLESRDRILTRDAIGTIYYPPLWHPRGQLPPWGPALLWYAKLGSPDDFKPAIHDGSLNWYVPVE